MVLHIKLAIRRNLKFETPAPCVQRECAWRSLKAETTEHASRDNTLRGTDNRRERNKRREDSSPLFSPLPCFLRSRVFSPRVFSPIVCFIPTRVFRQLSISSSSNYNHTGCSVVSAFSDPHAHSRGKGNRRCFEVYSTAHCT